VTANKVDDPERLERIASFNEMLREDIRQKDVGRSVLAKSTDDETARRIFYEVAT